MVQKIGKKTKIQINGFTLVELLVAMGIFMTVTGIISTSFIRAMRTQKAAIALMAANDGITLALEQMAREIRTGSSFEETRENEELTFINYKQETVRYILSEGGIDKVEIDPNTLETTRERITPDTADIARFDIFISGNGEGDRMVSRITISLGVNLPGGGETYNTVQTTISPRTLINES